VCGRTVSQGPQLRLLRDLLSDVIVDVFSGVQKHGGLTGAIDGANAFREARAEALISVGGGSTIDSAKCIALMLAADGADLEQFRVQERDGERVDPTPIGATVLHVAIPTTAGSASEVMPWAGIRDEVRRQKMLFHDAALVPEIAVLDPRFVADTDPDLTASSAMTSLARSIETIYSSARQPISESLALTSLRLMLRALPAVMADGHDLAARADTQVAAALSGIAAENSMVSLVHAVGHSVGGRFALQHGIAHAIMLPAAATLCLPTLPLDTLTQVASALGIIESPSDADSLVSASVDRLRAVVEPLPLPQRLRDVGVPEEELDEITEQTLHDHMFAFTPISVDRSKLRQILQATW
jgi:alcohol dehydrogenase class IV